VGRIAADGHIAWFPASAAGAARLAVERRVLGLLAKRCSFRVPEILFVSNSGFDVRRMVPGRCDPWGLYRRCQADRRLAQKIGRAIGQILVEQHTRIVEADAAGWLRQHVPWPETGAWIGERLPSVIDDRGLIRALADVIEEYEGMAVDAADRALVHGDLGLHNLALDQADAVNGVFDHDGAAWVDRHHDFRYLLFADAARSMANGFWRCGMLCPVSKNGGKSATVTRLSISSGRRSKCCRTRSREPDLKLPSKQDAVIRAILRNRLATDSTIAYIRSGHVHDLLRYTAVRLISE
jgi:hypothetical protein